MLKIREGSFSPQHSSPQEYYDLGLSYQNFAVACGKNKEYDQALSYFLKAMKLWQEQLSADHPDLAALYSSLGHLYSEMGNPEEALHYNRKNICILEHLLPAKHPKLVQAYQRAGDACLALRDWSSAQMFYQKALESTDSDRPEQQALQAQIDSLTRHLDASNTDG